MIRDFVGIFRVALWYLFLSYPFHFVIFNGITLFKLSLAQLSHAIRLHGSLGVLWVSVAPAIVIIKLNRFELVEFFLYATRGELPRVLPIFMSTLIILEKILFGVLFLLWLVLDAFRHGFQAGFPIELLLTSLCLADL